MRSQGLLLPTADDGWVWTLAAVDHWNAECVGLACVQGGEPLCGPRAARARARATLRVGRGGRGPQGGAADGSRQPVSVGPLPQSASVLGHPPQLRLARRAGNQWRRRALESHAQGASRLRPGLRNLAEVRAAVAAFVERYNHCWRLEKLAYRTPSKRVSNTSYAGGVAQVWCPRNRVRYIVRSRVCADSMRADLPALVCHPRCTL